ncbi:FtsK/SpoIIIE domain-containing protein [Bacillus thuringiensis]|uniref:FtsK/SpoIIIE domain-containing protein n=1 Tax=Bacillus thuringiensis TaxID=1428 RepID=UPI000BFC4E39|nr:FtsK/SpoIIIE domain-containing protein [Bacillus thuringiensis]PGT90090.1 hypothetical protein COD17_10090 [Bacillus thuringiensis]
MINFSDKNLYERERGKFERFLDKKLETNTEYAQNTQYSKGDEEEETMMDSVIGGDGFDFGTGDGAGWGDDNGGWGGAEPGDKSGVTSAMDWQKENWVKTILMSPLYLVSYVFKDMTKDKPQKEEWEHILVALNKINIVSGAIALSVMLLGLNSPFTPSTQLFVAVASFLGTSFALKKFYNKGVFAKNEEGEEGTDTAEEGSEFALGGDDLDFANMNYSPADGVDTDFGLVGASDEDYEEDDGDEDDDVDDAFTIAQSPISVRNDTEFNQTLLEAFGRGHSNTGREINERISLLQSFSDYIITNDRKFGKFRVPKERSPEYNNLSYALFKGLVAVKSEFETDDKKMTVLSIKGNPLFYKIEVMLPSYFKEDILKRKLDVFEGMLKDSSADKEVSVLIESAQGIITFKFLRFDSRTLVSLGDILRFNVRLTKDGTALEQFADQKKGLPVLLGLQGNETPYVVDLEKSTSGAIVGGSGSGKSWFTFSLMWNFVLANSYDQVQFLILDAKNATFWKAFSRMPHVLGLHYDKDTFLQVLMEVEDERARRQAMLEEYGAEDFRGLRAKLRAQGDYETLKNVPLLIVIMDEITATMKYFKGLDDNGETYNAVRGVMAQITAQSRSAGVRIYTIGQRSIDTSVPKDVMSNSSFKFCMKLDNPNDIKSIFDEDAMKEKKPDMTGMGIALTSDHTTRTMIKTLTLGGTSDDQMLTLIRVVAFDWIRRAHGNVDLTKLPTGMNMEFSFNRPQFYEKTMQEMKEGKILSPMTVSAGYEIDLENTQTRSKLAPIDVEATEVVNDSPVSLQKDEKASFYEGSQNIVIPAVEGFTEAPKLAKEDTQDAIAESTSFAKKENDFIPSVSLTKEDEVIESKAETQESKISSFDDFISMDALIPVAEEPVVVEAVKVVEDIPFPDFTHIEDTPTPAVEEENILTFAMEEVVTPLNKVAQEVEVVSDTINPLEIPKDKLQEKAEIVDSFGSEYSGDEEDLFSLDSETDCGNSSLADTNVGDNSGETDKDAVGEILDFGADNGKNAPKIAVYGEKVNDMPKLHQPSDSFTQDSFSGTGYDEDDLGDLLGQLTEPHPPASPVPTIGNVIEGNEVRKEHEQETQKPQTVVKTPSVQEANRVIPTPSGYDISASLIDTETPTIKSQKQETRKTEETHQAPIGTVTITYDSPKVEKKEEPQETVEQYILVHGEKVDMFTYRMEKAVLQSVYTKKKIDQALNMLLILEEGTYYMAEK